MDVFFLFYNLIISKEGMMMNVLNILNNPELSDIPILYILRVIHAVQKENSNEQLSSFSEKLFEIDEQVKE